MDLLNALPIVTSIIVALCVFLIMSKREIKQLKKDISVLERMNDDKFKSIRKLQNENIELKQKFNAIIEVIDPKIEVETKGRMVAF